jgi:16S rRNA (uracil1498-N3)-methyltransferase
MPIERYLLEEELSEGEAYSLTDGEFHHLFRVVRARCNDEVEVVNGKGVLARAVITDIAKDRAKLTITQRLHVQPFQQQLILVQGLPKLNRLDFILEKGTELGVDQFILFPGELSIKKEFSPHQQERARAITIAAMKQCGRLFLPQVVLRPPLDEWEDPVPGRLFYGDTNPDAPLFEKVWREGRTDLFPLMFVVGPESGLSQNEEEKLKSLGADGVKIHSNILRTDTASLAALSLMSHWLMEEDLKKFLKK